MARTFELFQLLKSQRVSCVKYEMLWFKYCICTFSLHRQASFFFYSHPHVIHSYLFQVPFDNSGGIVYVWIGKKCNKEQTIHAEEIGEQLAEENYSLQVLQEGEEPENFFWVGIGGKKEICDVSII